MVRMPSTEKSRKPRVVVVAFDGGTWDIVKPLVRQGKMPVVQSLMGQGKWGTLKSTFPPLTCPAWFSLSTGKNPGKLGIYNFFTLVKGTYQVRVFNNHDVFGHKELWDILNEHGIRCAVINNPIAYPPKVIDKYMVAGFMAPSKEKEFTSPPSLKERLDRVADGYEIDAIHGDNKEDDAVLEANLRILEKRAKVFQHFLEDEGVRFFLLTFTGTDRICHQLLNKVHSHDKKIAQEASFKVERFFTRLDWALGEVLKKVGREDYFILFSDHGFGKRDKGFYINQWLIDNRYLFIKKEPLKKRFVKMAKSLPGYRFLRKGLIRLRLWDLLRKGVKVPPGSTPRPIEGEGESIIGLIRQGRVDWSRTKAITIPDGIYFNTSDRPQGIVSKGEYPALRDEVIKRLENVRDPQSGRPIKIKAFKPEDLYQGSLIDRAPGVMPVVEDYAWGLIRNIPKRGEWVGDLKLAHHREEGMLLLRGPGVSEGAVADAEIIDLAPTILNLFSIPVPREMDGKVLSFE
jgi:predicted AlkP superfamily phosphohydrolase/phosphomutase